MYVLTMIYNTVHVSGTQCCYTTLLTVYQHPPVTVSRSLLIPYPRAPHLAKSVFQAEPQELFIADYYLFFKSVSVLHS